MSVILSKIGNSTNIPLKQYVCDTLTDLTSINQEPFGTVCYVVEEGKFYHLGANGVWSEDKSQGGGSGAVSSVNGKTGVVVLDANDVGAVATEEGKGLSTNDYTTAEKTKLAGLHNYDDSVITADIAALQSDVNAIEEKIPAQASAQNQLGDKAFINSSIATNTATYISNNGEPFTSLAQLQAYAGVVTNNDYAFITGVDSEGNTFYDRYKATVDGSTITWAKEYRLNNSSFTANQWAAIQSGITSTAVGQITTNQTDIAGIVAKITSAASSLNQLMDKSYIDTADASKVNIIAYSSSSNVDQFCSVYGVDNSNNPKLYKVRRDGTAYSIAQRGSNGTIVAGTPTSDTHATTKLYVDTADANKIDKIAYESREDTTVAIALYGTSNGDVQHLYKAAVTSAPNTIVFRSAAGNVTCAVPTSGTHAANKTYVDGLNTYTRKGYTITIANAPAERRLFYWTSDGRFANTDAGQTGTVENVVYFWDDTANINHISITSGFNVKHYNPETGNGVILNGPNTAAYNAYEALENITLSLVN